MQNQRYSGSEVGSIIDEILCELEQLGIADARLADFCEAWTEYLSDNFNYTREEDPKAKAMAAVADSFPDDRFVNSDFWRQ